jgi:asparagine synthase (glutamine-hydrolysing)
VIEAAAATQVKAAAWQGWIRAGSGFPASGAESRPARVELGAAVFSLPEPQDAITTSWARAEGRFGIFSGFLFNRRELAKELWLEVDGGGSDLPSPAELLLAAYRRWGCDLARELDGSFAWAVWDESNDLLLCGRDALGWHPLYYCAFGEELIFSWDFETVRRHPRVSHELNRVALAEHLTRHLTDPQETFFEGVRRLPNGHALRFSRGRCDVFRYWDPVPVSGPVRWVTPEELTEFPSLLRKAVAGAMDCGGGRAGILLSGGLDSVSVAAFAAEVAAERGWAAPRAYSVVFPDQAFERPVQEQVAARLGFSQVFANIANYAEVTWLLRGALAPAAACPSPPTFVFAPPFLDLLRLAGSEQRLVTLTGNGGDELLTVTPAWVADLIQSGDWVEMARQVRMLVRYWEVPIYRTLSAVFWTHGVRALVRDWVWKHAAALARPFRRRLLSQAVPAWMIPDPALRRELTSRFEERFEKEISQGSFYLAHMNMALLDSKSNMIQEEQFYRNLGTGTFTLHPYWNPPLADFLLRVRPEVLTAGAQSKSMIRKMLAERFPQLGFERQKKVVASDFAKTVFQRELPELWAELGQPRRMSEMGLVDPGRYLEALAPRMRSDTMRDLNEAWHGAGIEAWIRLHD